LAGAAWALLRKPSPPPKPIVPKFNAPEISGTARLTTQTISTGLATITASVEAADTQRFELRYVMERDARPDATRITISVGEGDDDR